MRATGPVRLVVEYAGAESQYSFGQPFVLIGRDPRADVRFDDGRLSPRHAYLQVAAGRLLYVDFQGPARARQVGWLDAGQTFELGPLRIRLPDGSRLPSWAASGASWPYDRGTLPAVRLELTSHSAHASWRMRQPLALVGSSRACKVRLLDPGVSQFHCGLVRTPHGLWAVDLLGRGGIAVNGTATRAARLDDGDQLRLGECSICARHDAPAEALSAAPDTALAEHAAFAVPATNAPHATIRAVHATNGWGGNDLVSIPLAVQLAQIRRNLTAEIHQEVVEQFRQAVGVFNEEFQAMHREQGRLVRRELKRIRRLTRELSDLQTELSRRWPADRGELPPTDVAPTAKPIVRTKNPDSPPQPATPTGEEIPNASSKPKGESAAEVHAWLSHRVAEIHRQSQGRWRKILNLMLGKPPGRKRAPPGQAT